MGVTSARPGAGLTEYATAEWKVYFCAVKDVASRRSVVSATSDRMTSRSADATLRTKVARRRPTDTVTMNSERGGPFRPGRYERTLRDDGFVGSMGRFASAESYVALFAQ